MIQYKYSIKREKVREVQEESCKVMSPGAAAEFLQTLDCMESDQEHFLVLFLSTKNQVKGYSLISMGLLERTHVHPREVFRAAILNASAKIILAHNHPSGDCTPSLPDIATTVSLRKAGEIIGIEVMDHIIIGEKSPKNPSGFLSLQSAGEWGEI